MDDMESKMSAILGNPEMMSKIMAMAQSLNADASPPQESQQKKEEQAIPASSQIPNIDLSLMQKLSGFAGQSRIDKNQQTLLRALGPYLNKDRINKLEKAMRAAKMASLASSFLGNSGFLSNIGR